MYFLIEIEHPLKTSNEWYLKGIRKFCMSPKPVAMSTIFS